MRRITTLFYRRLTTIGRALGGYPTWPLPTAVSFPPRTSARRKSWELGVWPYPHLGACRASARSSRSNVGSTALCAGAPVSKPPSARCSTLSRWSAPCKGESGFQRYVGWSVITKNLFSIARWQERRKKRSNHVQVDGVSSPGESHPEALAELYVSLSTHTAPTMEPRRTPICQWANNSGARREMRAIHCVALRRCRCSFWYFLLAQRARSRSRARMLG